MADEVKRHDTAQEARQESITGGAAKAATEAADTLSDAARRAADTAQDYVGRASTQAQSVAEDAYRRSAEMAQDYYTRGRTMLDQQVRSDPWVTILVAAGIGALLGYIFGREAGMAEAGERWDRRP